MSNLGSAAAVTQGRRTAAVAAQVTEAKEGVAMVARAAAHPTARRSQAPEAEAEARMAAQEAAS